MKTKLQATTQKSYYGKATTRTENGATILTSYATDVCKIENGKIFRLWAGWSSTTAKHINDFLTQNGFAKLSKKEWVQMPCENPKEVYQIHQSNGFFDHKGTALLTDEEARNFADKLQSQRKNFCVWYE